MARLRRRCSECGRVLNRRGRRRFDHVQVALSLGEMHAHVDEGIAGLIFACWRVGIYTTASCQGQADDELGRAFIGFEVGHAERFADLVTTEDPEHAPDEALGVRVRLFNLEPSDSTAWQWVPAWYGEGFIAYFPAADILELTRRLGVIS